MADKKSGLGDYDSYSSKYMAQHSSGVPQVSPKMANAVSDVRRAILAEEVSSGLFSDGSGPGKISSQYSATPLGNVISASSGNGTGIIPGTSAGLTKNAQMGGGPIAHGGYAGHGGTAIMGPEVYSPLWLISNLSLPRDRATINAWCRSFFALNPYVHNAISLHSTYPISKLSIKCPNKDIEKFFNDMIEEIDLMNVCIQIAQEYWLLGEAFVYAELDESKGKWSRLHIQNPDFMIVKRTVVASEPIIMLRPDDNLKKIIFSNRPNDIEQRKQLNQHIIDSVRKGENIPLPNFNVSHLARRISPYEIHGTGLPVCVFRALMLMDRLKESKFVQADQMINPTTVVKIGSADYKPSYADLEAYRAQFEAAENNKSFKIFTHDGVDIQRIGFGQGILDVQNDFNQLIKEIFIGLQVPQVMMDGGADTTYANGGVALDLLRQRYMSFRNMLSHWLKNKIFAPISKLQGFYDYSGGNKQLIVPEIDWNHMSLFDASDYIQTLVTLTTGEPTQRRASVHTLYRSLGLEYEDEVRQLRKESIQDAIVKKEKAALDSMELNSLRSLDDDDEIPEPITLEDGKAPAAEAPVPGEAPGGGGMPDLGLGNLPPMPSGGGGVSPTSGTPTAPATGTESPPAPIT